VGPLFVASVGFPIDKSSGGDDAAVRDDGLLERGLLVSGLGTGIVDHVGTGAGEVAEVHGEDFGTGAAINDGGRHLHEPNVVPLRHPLRLAPRDTKDARDFRESAIWIYKSVAVAHMTKLSSTVTVATIFD